MAMTYSCILVGVEVCVVEIETVIGSGFSGLNILGLPTDATRDMRERVRSALESVGIPIPARRVVVNVGPPELIKLTRTSLHQLDFAVAACIIRALYEDKSEEKILFQPVREFLAGELSLCGELKPIANSLIYEAIGATKIGEAVICLPYYGKQSLRPFEYYKNLKNWIESRKNPSVSLNPIENTLHEPNAEAFLQLNSQRLRQAQATVELLIKNPRLCVAVLVAAAGGHNILIAGEPGAGKSFSLKQMPFLLRPLNQKQQIEVKLIHGGGALTEPPFRFPHHSTTAAALVGGASLRPGEVTLAHHGVLFLDELAEFPRTSLEALREPLDSGCVTLSRASGNILYPAKFQLCATANPCPCGYMFSRKRPCRCNPTDSRKYLQKISGPLLDRFCLQIWVGSRHDTEESDIFSQSLQKTLESGKAADFLMNFFTVQEELSQRVKKEELTEIDCDFSLRGREKIFQIAHTLEKLFPPLKEHPQFSKDVLLYRSLVSLFNKSIF